MSADPAPDPDGSGEFRRAVRPTVAGQGGEGAGRLASSTSWRRSASGGRCRGADLSRRSEEWTQCGAQHRFQPAAFEVRGWEDSGADVRCSATRPAADRATPRRRSAEARMSSAMIGRSAEMRVYRVAATSLGGRFVLEPGKAVSDQPVIPAARCRRVSLNFSVSAAAFRRRDVCSRGQDRGRERVQMSPCGAEEQAVIGSNRRRDGAVP